MGNSVTEQLRAQVGERLPRRARWLVGGTPWDWDFSRARDALKPIAESDVADGTPIRSDWLKLYVFGQEDYAEGGGASPLLTVHIETGIVHGLDVERDGEASFLLNSSVVHFIETFFVFDQVLRTGTASRRDLLDLVRAADPDAFTRSEWRAAVDYVQSSVLDA
jgi:hypothetical protein